VSHRDLLTLTAPLPGNVVQVPVVRQRRGFSCGAAVTLAVLRYWSHEKYVGIEEDALYPALKTTDARGTEPEPMAALLKLNGLVAEYRCEEVTVGDLERAVDARQPPIIDLQAWQDGDRPWRETWDSGHYVVMVGYDDQRLFFADPSTMTPHGYAFLPRGEFEERWHDLTGDHDEPARRMTIFAHGDRAWAPSAPLPAEAVRLG
jgi:predicted double-glycine peptidase